MAVQQLTTVTKEGTQPMQLLIVDSEGNTYEVLDNIEEFTLSKPVARSVIMDAIRSTLERIESLKDSSVES